MRKIITTTFITMDGVMQAPGGPQEDTSGGFTQGGWTFGYWDKLMGDTMTEFMSRPFELLLGKKTYNIFAAFWPTAKTDEVVAKPFNSTKKYVVTHSPMDLTWNNSYLVTGDVAAEIAKLKQMDGPDLWVHGSGNLIQTLLKNSLIDQMVVWTFPVTIGNGKKLFAEGTQAQEFKMMDSKISSTGVIIGTYEPAGSIKTGTVGE